MTEREREEAIKIVASLQGNGYTAYFTGGCVRDRLLGRKPSDIDIATSATPHDVENIFRENVYPDIGNSKKFGVVLVKSGEFSFEVATFRSDGEYSDGRRPDSVEFTTPEEDAQRRDFTINGLFEDPIADKIYDYVDGIKDLESKTLRFIGDPKKRIEEDALRMLRGVRFEAQLPGFQLEQLSKSAIQYYAPNIISVSKERVRDEIMKAFNTSYAHTFISRMEQLGLLDSTLEEVRIMKLVPQNALYHPEGNVFTHTILVLAQLRNEHPLLKLAGLFHDIGKPSCFDDETWSTNSHDSVGANLTEEIMQRLCFSNDEIDYVSWMVKNHMRITAAMLMKTPKFLRFAADPRFEDLLLLANADAKGSLCFDSTLLERIWHRMAIISPTKKPEVPESLLSGKQIMVILGIDPGPEVGKAKEYLIDLQLSKKISSRKEAMEALIRRFKLSKQK